MTVAHGKTLQETCTSSREAGSEETSKEEAKSEVPKEKFPKSRAGET